MDSDEPNTDAARVAVFAPSPILTVTFEDKRPAPELHLHAGGQGFWVAQMLRALGIDVTFCAPLGGEVGGVLRSVLESRGLELRAVETTLSNGSYVHRRAAGELTTIGETVSPALTRHEEDALYTIAVAAGLEARLLVLTGTRPDDLLDSETYRRLAGDLRTNGVTVVADLSGHALRAALAGGLDVLHLSERELGEHCGRRLRDVPGIVAAIDQIHAEGAGNIVVSRGAEVSIALLDERLLELRGPVFEAREHRGAGDSMLAAIASALARGHSLDEAVRLGAAAGAVNVLRRGLGTGSRADIERVAREVELRPLRRTSVST